MQERKWSIKASKMEDRRNQDGGYKKKDGGYKQAR